MGSSVTWVSKNTARQVSNSKSTKMKWWILALSLFCLSMAVFPEVAEASGRDSDGDGTPDIDDSDDDNDGTPDSHDTDDDGDGTPDIDDTDDDNDGQPDDEDYDDDGDGIPDTEDEDHADFDDENDEL